MTQATYSRAQERRISSALPVLAAFLVIGFLLLPFYRYELGPDGISYISIAEHYTAGQWREAVNAYWAPLYSWCIAALLSIRVPEILATKIVALAAGAVALFGLSRISLKFRMDSRIQKLFIGTTIPVLFAFVMEANTPDLLFTAVLLLYFAVIFNPDYPATPYAGALCGVLGALAYLTKSYGLLFFAAHFVIFSTLHWLFKKDLRRRVAIQSLAGLGILCVLSFAWIAVLHAKFGTWMLGTTGAFNHRLVGPQSAGYPHFRQLVPPSGEHAITAWEDPSPSWLPDWNALGSAANLKHQFKLVYVNARHILEFWSYTSPLAMAFVLAYVVLCLQSPMRAMEWVYPLLTIVLFSAGYLLLTVQGRYLWLTDLLLLWIAFRALDLLFKAANLNAAGKTLLIVVTVLSFLAGPVRTLQAHFLKDRSLYQWSEQIKTMHLARGRMASCGDWQDSAYIAYRLGLPYYGVPAATQDADETARELNPDYRAGTKQDSNPNEIAKVLSNAGIDYFLEWPHCESIPAEANRVVTRAGDIKLVRLR